MSKDQLIKIQSHVKDKMQVHSYSDYNRAYDLIHILATPYILLRGWPEVDTKLCPVELVCLTVILAGDQLQKDNNLPGLTVNVRMMVGSENITGGVTISPTSWCQVASAMTYFSQQPGSDMVHVKTLEYRGQLAVISILVKTGHSNKRFGIPVAVLEGRWYTDLLAS